MASGWASWHKSPPVFSGLESGVNKSVCEVTMSCGFLILTSVFGPSWHSNAVQNCWSEVALCKCGIQCMLFMAAYKRMPTLCRLGCLVMATGSHDLKRPWRIWCS
eukprot:scaffold319998_cov21-Tisochrysis_lutea.AAC.1